MNSVTVEVAFAKNDPCSAAVSGLFDLQIFQAGLGCAIKIVDKIKAIW